MICCGAPRSTHFWTPPKSIISPFTWVRFQFSKVQMKPIEKAAADSSRHVATRSVPACLQFVIEIDANAPDKKNVKTTSNYTLRKIVGLISRMASCHVHSHILHDDVCLTQDGPSCSSLLSCNYFPLPLSLSGLSATAAAFHSGSQAWVLATGLNHWQQCQDLFKKQETKNHRRGQKALITTQIPYMSCDRWRVCGTPCSWKGPRSFTVWPWPCSGSMRRTSWGLTMQVRNGYNHVILWNALKTAFSKAKKQKNNASECW